jgi:2-isopropylmalate synthase
MAKRKIEILDTTLRDGAQMEGISFSVNDKFQVLENLAALGIRYVEAGNPGSKSKDREFFAKYQKEANDNYGRALAAFGSTRRKGIKPQDDSGLADLLSAGTETIVVFGKCWDLQVREVLRVSRKENLLMIEDTIAWLTAKGER